MKQLGFSTKKEYIVTIWIVVGVVAFGFSALYIGLGFLGNHFPIPSEIMASATNKGVYVLSRATQEIFGSIAQVFLAVMVSVTCFTTTVGLIVSSSEFFNRTFPRMTYKTFATIFTLIGFAVANLGLNAIIQYSVPVLQILYPITMTIVMMVIVNKFFALSKVGMRLTIALVTLISFLSILANFFKLAELTVFIHQLPLANASLAWLVPALLGIFCSLFLPNKQKSDEFHLPNNG